MEDYIYVGKALGIQTYDVDQIAENSKGREESPTVNIIKRWRKDKKRKMTIGMLQYVLTRLSLVAKMDSVKAIEEVLEANTSKSETNCEKCVIEMNISEYLLQWRLVLRRRWDLIETDMDPNMLTSSLLYLPPKDCLIFEGTGATDVQQRIKNANTLLLFLLWRDGRLPR
ncbi:uncharacterized protein [Amphiura filiformis]|uniref:uncharacterized protein n=1 Tax=Amphiura filiformis TaxID=82378 RepID=UPI003B21D981